MMVKSSIFFLLLLCCTLGAQTKMDDILGNWVATDNSVKVNIYKDGGTFKAKLIWYDINLGSGKPIHAAVDGRNPNHNLRNRKIIGMEVLQGLHFNASTKRWEKGKIYDASSGRTWDSYAQIRDDGELIVRGYWKWQWIGKTLHFKRY
ncbi:DUF2147 domain-containing protein [Kaistella yonginensis]|uniref:DUF2147 domain-containing protein n=1 Tax=Kaistella yonginensis TaxID=658267 RepID=UPI0025B5284E|nr:DUF2147 domain-containing protein [Kaistella yonginensis]